MTRPPKGGFYKLRPRRAVASDGIIHGIMEAFVVLRQRFVDVSCRDGGMAGGTCDLVEIRYDVSRSIHPVDRRAMMSVYFQASDIVRLCAQGGRKLGSNCAAEGRIDNIKGEGLAALQDRSDFLTAMLDGTDRSCNFCAGFVKQFGCFVVLVSLLIQI